ncbi:MAG: efflux RND transporter periplasmic adaptor subunit [Paludibacter sp.]|nr:efflux RND transporter periplasmic adaptor subunit [Paludibacter sp.]
MKNRVYILEDKKAFINTLLFLLLIIVIIVVFLSCSSNKRIDKESQNKTENGTAMKHYVCSMHPQVVQDKPGDCPICGMSLIEKVVDANPADTTLNDVVSPVNESVLSSITTVHPAIDNLPLIVEASGIINFDTRKIHMVSARYGGLIEKSYIKSQFQRIKKGQAIFQIYCPDIYTEKWNYIKLLQMYPDQDNLTVEAREWLKLLGLTSAQIEALKHSVKPDYHLMVYSDVDGYAVPADFDPEKYYSSENNEGNNQTGSKGIGLNDGITIQTGTPLFKVVDVRSLRADLKVKTEEVRLLKKGQRVTFSANASPAKRIEAVISQIEPLNGGVFQLVKVYFTDKDGVLFPGRQIQATIQAGTTHSIWLPETTVVNMGQHKSVFVKHDNKFLATVIKTGIHTGNKVEILSGVDQQSKVALNASLLIDSDGLIK